MKKLTLLLFVLIAFIATPIFAADVSKMTKEELRMQLGSDNVVVLDVRTGNDWTSSNHKIEGAIRENPKHVDNWLNKYDKNKKFVLYCS